LRRYAAVLGQRLLSLNLLEAEGTPAFEPSRVINVNGVKVGFIGLIVPRQDHCLNFADSGRALARESRRLREAGAARVREREPEDPIAASTALPAALSIHRGVARLHQNHIERG
jgi:hypothetical protein